jgi:NAD(P)H dehydrogenase (quinone)
VILVTGATGNIGRALVAHLVAAGAPVRTLVRDIQRGAALLPGVPLALGDFGNPASLASALVGVKQLFFVCLSEPAPERLRKHDHLIATAKAAGVEHVVYLSFLNPAPDANFPQARWHFDTEQKLRASGMGWTFLRASLYAQSVLRAAGIWSEGRWMAPAGNGRVAFVDRDDLAAVAARCLLEPGHSGQAYDVTGPQLLSWHAIAEMLASLTGQPVEYEDVAPDVLGQALLTQGRNPAFIEGMLGLFEDIRAHRVEALSHTIQSVGRRSPGTLLDVLRTQLP